MFKKCVNAVCKFWVATVVLEIEGSVGGALQLNYPGFFDKRLFEGLATRAPVSFTTGVGVSVMVDMEVDPGGVFLDVCFLGRGIAYPDSRLRRRRIFL